MMNDIKVTNEYDFKAWLESQTILDMVPVDKIHAADYCRPVSEHRLNLLGQAGFDKRALGFLVVSLQADGSYHVIDGNHRLHLARRMELKSVPCRIFLDLTLAEEADLFTKLNTINRPTALDRFRSRLIAKDPEAVDIERIVETFGLTIGLGGRWKSSKSPGAITSIAALEKTYRDLGPYHFQNVIRLLYTIWGTDKNAWTTEMVNGMRQFWARYHDLVDQRVLVDKLQKVLPQRLIAEANIGSASVNNDSSGSRVGKQILAHYNKGRRSRLPDWVANVGSRPLYEPLRQAGQKEVKNV